MAQISVQVVLAAVMVVLVAVVVATPPGIATEAVQVDNHSPPSATPYYPSPSKTPPTKKPTTPPHHGHQHILLQLLLLDQKQQGAGTRTTLRVTTWNSLALAPALLHVRLTATLASLFAIVTNQEQFAKTLVSSVCTTDCEDI
ncbi:hypothetical protein PIB30_081728 [Stylosanthes scabra]|uniref:Uncharacterized protein n=1 Tax=Stylosanthes scabra TaxID=79078 RepID=A0ABU6RRS4_9FABA|nr:hypothetical protein [Stylosanthes scabra]